MIPTISGNLLLARSKPRRHNWIGFWHSFAAARFENLGVNPLVRFNRYTVSISHCRDTNSNMFASSQSPALSARVTAANGEPFLVKVYVKALRTGEDVERETDDAGDSGKVSVQGKKRGAML